MTKIILIFVITTSLFSYGQKDSLRKIYVSNYLELEMFEGKHTYVIDTIIKINSISIYCVTPFTSEFSFCIFFDKNDSIVELKDFPSTMNRIPYDFMYQGNGYFSVKWMGSGTTSISIGYYIIKISRESISVVYKDMVYFFDKENGSSYFNSFKLFIKNKEVFIEKTFDDCTDLLTIMKKYHLKLEFEIKKESYIEEYYLEDFR